MHTQPRPLSPSLFAHVLSWLLGSFSYCTRPCPFALAQAGDTHARMCMCVRLASVAHAAHQPLLTPSPLPCLPCLALPRQHSFVLSFFLSLFLCLLLLSFIPSIQPKWLITHNNGMLTRTRAVGQAQARPVTTTTTTTTKTLFPIVKARAMVTAIATTIKPTNLTHTIPYPLQPLPRDKTLTFRTTRTLGRISRRP